MRAWCRLRRPSLARADPTSCPDTLLLRLCGAWQAMYDVPMFLPVATPVDFTAYLPVGDVMNK